MRYALIGISTGFVENVIELEEGHNWPIPDGYQVVQSDVAGPGWYYIDGVFYETPPD